MLMLEDQDYCNMDMCMELDALGCPIPKHDTINLYTKERNTVYGKFTLYEAQKWLRKKHQLHISTKPYPTESGLMWMFEVRKITPYKVCVEVNKTGFWWSEEAFSEGINECIKLLKKYELESNDIVSDTN